MDEYIGREIVLSEIDKAFRLFEEHDDIIRLFSDVRSCVIYANAVDAVPVVRCGQCKFDNICCRNVGKDGKRTKDDFCSYGERMVEDAAD